MIDRLYTVAVEEKEHKKINTYVEILMSCKDESSWGGIPFVNKFRQIVLTTTPIR